MLERTPAAEAFVCIIALFAETVVGPSEMQKRGPKGPRFAFRYLSAKTEALDSDLRVEVNVDRLNAGTDCTVVAGRRRVTLGERRASTIGLDVADAGTVVEVTRIDGAVKRTTCRTIAAEHVARRVGRRPRRRRSAEARVEEVRSQHDQLDLRAQVVGDLKVTDDRARLLVGCRRGTTPSAGSERTDT